MIYNLVNPNADNREADIVIIGGGTVGLMMSVLLAREHGISVICLESGAHEQLDEEHHLNDVVHSKSFYSGAVQGRFRCLGGTSTRWGGALIPFLKRDIQNAKWPIHYESLTEFIPELEQLFELNNGAYDDLLLMNDLGMKNHVPRLAKWPPFRKRNVFNLFSKEVKSKSGPEVWVNATVVEFLTNATELHTIIAKSPNGNKLKVTGKKFIFAAGAIETTRLALLLDRQNDNIISKVSPALGSYFCDHLSTEVATIVTNSTNKLNKIFGFRFEKGGVMRNLRFELSENCEIRKLIPPCFAHVGFSTDFQGGFDYLREIYKHLQQNKLPHIRLIANLTLSAPWLFKAIWWRFIEKRLVFPASAQLILHMVIEQVPYESSQISLSEEKLDVYGQPLAQIDWTVSDKDIDNLNKATNYFLDSWNSSTIRNCAKIIPMAPSFIAKNLKLGGEFYHPTGSTRMSDKAENGVVDRNLRIFALPNTYLLSTASFPTGGGTNPTMMLLLLGLKCVKELKNVLGDKTKTDNLI